MLSSLIRKVSSFTYLNLTQFLGALNDNIYKLLIVYFLIQQEGIEYSHQILATTGALFVLPFILFSALSGTLADRFSKRNIIISVKFLEVFTMILGIIAFTYESKFASYAILFLLATHSALFGPSKYGILPELVSTDKISSANGLMTSFTFLAIIFGTFLASFLVDITGRNFILACFFCLLLALVGVAMAMCIQYTPPAGSTKKIDAHFFKDILETLQAQRDQPSLLVAVFGSAFFLFLGAFVQLNMIPFAVHSLNLTDVQGGYLFLLTAIGIGTGALIAGKISGKIVELGLVPLAGVGVVICCYMLDLFSDRLHVVIPLVMAVGMFGGMWQIPLDSYIQVASPQKSRGRVVAATNFLSFIGVLLASGLLYILEEIFSMGPDKGFTVVGTLTLLFTLIIGYQYFDYLTRYIGMILSRLHFSVTYHGREVIPEGPAIYVCNHTAWNDTLLILGAQRHRVRFFIEQEQSHSKWMLRIYRLLRVILIPSIEPLEQNQLCLHVIKDTLRRGISVCVFTDDPNIALEIQKLKTSLHGILDEKTYPFIAVTIEKGEKNHKSRFFWRLLQKFHIPAEITFGEVKQFQKIKGDDREMQINPTDNGQTLVSLL